MHHLNPSPSPSPSLDTDYNPTPTLTLPTPPFMLTLTLVSPTIMDKLVKNKEEPAWKCWLAQVALCRFVTRHSYVRGADGACPNLGNPSGSSPNPHP